MPTEAQIEAAARAIDEVTDEVSLAFRQLSTPDDERLQQYRAADLALRRKQAIAALTAAEAAAWQPIETAPKMKTILLFAVTDVDERGVVRNWKMATGSWHTGYENTESYTPWEWNGHQLRVFDIQPTHWYPLPQPPGETE